MSKKKIPGKVPPVKVKIAQRTDLLQSYKWLWELLAIFILVFITYGNSIKNDYNLDDEYVVSLDNNNTLTQQGISAIPEILKKNYNEGTGVTYGYRPLGKVTLAIEYSLWQNNPHYSHFVNVLLFAVNVILLLFFFRRVARLTGYKNEQAIYIAVFLFIIHPIHTEVVCSIKNREEILCFSFMLSALLCYFKFGEERKWKYVIPFTLCLVLSYLSKESAVNIIGILLLIIFLQVFIVNKFTFSVPGNLMEKIRIKYTVAFFVALFIYFMLPDTHGLFFLLFFILLIRSILKNARQSQQLDNKKQDIIFKILLGFSVILPLVFLAQYIRTKLAHGDIEIYFEQNPYHFISTSGFLIGIQSFLFYLKKLIIPFPLLFYYGFNMLPVKGWNSPDPYVAIFLFAVFLFFVIYSFTKKKKVFICFALLIFLGTLFPFCNFLSNYYVTGIVAERLVFQASAGFCLLVSLLIFELIQLLKSKFISISTVRFQYIFPAMIAVPFLFITISRNGNWENKTSLYQHDIKYLGNSARSNYMMASRNMNDITPAMDREEAFNKIQAAMSCLHRALTIYPAYNDAWMNLARIHYNYLSNVDSALYCYNKVDTSNRYIYARAREYLGDIVYNNFKNKEAAKAFYLQGFQHMPERNVLYDKIIKILFESNRNDSILVFSDTGIKNNFIEAYIDKADAYVNLKDTLSAIPFYKKGIQLGYDHPIRIDINALNQVHKN